MQHLWRRDFAYAGFLVGAVVILGDMAVSWFIGSYDGIPGIRAGTAAEFWLISILAVVMLFTVILALVEWHDEVLRIMVLLPIASIPVKLLSEEVTTALSFVYIVFIFVGSSRWFFTTRKRLVAKATSLGNVCIAQHD